jgi:hypothetical protein
VGLPIDDIDRSLEAFTDLDLSFMFDRHSKELDIDIVHMLEGSHVGSRGSRM